MGTSPEELCKKIKARLAKDGGPGYSFSYKTTVEPIGIEATQSGETLSFEEGKGWEEEEILPVITLTRLPSFHAVRAHNHGRQLQISDARGS